MAAPHHIEPITPEDRLYKIVQDSMCTGCGLCQSIAGPDRVKMQTVGSGYERPVVVGKLDHETVDRIYDVCPGTRVDGLPPDLIEDTTVVDRYWGPYINAVLAHATDHTTRIKAATGGVLTALSQYAIESKRVKFVLHAKASSRDATFGEHHLSFDAASVMDGSSSIYGPTAPLLDIGEILSRNEAFAFVGKPCDIAALRNLALFDNRVDRLVKYWLTPICGGYIPPVDLDKFLTRMGVTRQDLKSFKYRGDGCPGPVLLEKKTGEMLEAHMYDPWGGPEESNWPLPFRCKVCPDGPGESADISAGDQWEGGYPTPEQEANDPGLNAVFVRTGGGAELMNSAVNDGYITIESEMDPRWYDTCQAHQIAKKLAVRARWEGMRSEGRTVPRSAGLRLDAYFEEAGKENTDYQRNGTIERIRAGKASESKPSL